MLATTVFNPSHNVGRYNAAYLCNVYTLQCNISAPVLNAYFQFHMFGIISDLFGSLPEHHADQLVSNLNHLHLQCGQNIKQTYTNIIDPCLRICCFRIVASVAISCLLNSVWDFFKDTASDCHLPETNSSQLYDLKLQILKNEKVITETLQGNITALEAKVTHTRETTMEECQKVAQNSVQTNKTQMLALREMQEKQLKYIADQGTYTTYASYCVLL